MGADKAADIAERLSRASLEEPDEELEYITPRARDRKDGTLAEAQEMLDSLPSTRTPTPALPAKLKPPQEYVGCCTLWFSKCHLSGSKSELLAKSEAELLKEHAKDGGYLAPTGKAHSIAFAGFINEEDLELPGHAAAVKDLAAPSCSVKDCDGEMVDPHETTTLGNDGLDTYVGVRYGQLLERFGLGEYLAAPMLLGSCVDHLEPRHIEGLHIACCSEGHVVGFATATRVNLHKADKGK